MPLAVRRTRQLGLGLTVPTLRLPTLTVLLVYLLLGSGTLLLYTDPDFWWHLRTGQLIFDTGAIPKTDPFSFTAAGSRWVAHEWLSDVLIYGVEKGLGYWGNVLLFTVVALSALAVMHRLLLKIGVSPRVALTLVALGGVTSFPYWTVRPQAFSWLFAAIFLHTLWLRRIDGRTALWPLPLLMLLWANLHAGYVIGLLLVGLWLLASLGERVLQHKVGSLRVPVLLFLACLAATAVNPNGLALLAYPFTYLVPGNASQRFITEWQSPNFHSPLHWPLAVGIVTLALVGIRGRSWNLFRLALGVVFAFMALESSRHQPLFALVLMIVLGDALRELWPRARAEGKAAPPSGAPALNWAILASAVVALALVIGRSPNAQLNRSPLVSGLFDYPVEGASFIRNTYPNVHMFNAYRWGGYLINELYPQQRVFIDGRADMYGDGLVEEYVRVARLRPGWREVLTKYDIKLVIIEKDSPLAAALAEAQDWKLAFSGPVEAVFVRAGTAEPEPAGGLPPAVP